MVTAQLNILQIIYLADYAIRFVYSKKQVWEKQIETHCQTVGFL